MRKTTCLAIVMFLAACGGTEPVTDDGTRDDGVNAQNPGGDDATNPDGTTNPGGENNTTPGGANNTTPAGPNNTTPAGPNNTTPGDSNNTPSPSMWQALVGNGDITADTSSFSIVTFNGTSVTSTEAQPFGTGKLAVASSAGLGYVVDVKTGEMLVVESDGTIVDTIDLQVSEVDSAASANGMLLAASGDMNRIAQYDGSGGGLGSQIPIGSLAQSGDPLYVRNLTADGNLVAGVANESSMFASTPQVFVADASSSSMVQQIGVNGAMHLDSRGDGTFALATRFDGIKVFRQDGPSWVADHTLVDDSRFNRAEVEGVVMADANVGAAQTFSFDDSFQVYVFDIMAGTATQVDGFAVPTALTGGDASADGEYFFLGDYGIREQEEWGVGVVDREGNMLGKVVTDDLLPPMSITALN